jgi:hypothetical protein
MNRQELIKEAQNQRTKYMNKLSHNRGLTRLKKQQLQEVITDLRKINKALKNEDDDLEIRNLKDDQDELKHEGVLLEKEIKLIDGENEILELEYEEMANNQNDDEDDDENPKQRENNLQPHRKIRINEIIESIKTSNDDDEEDEDISDDDNDDDNDDHNDHNDDEDDEDDDDHSDEEDEEEDEKPKKKTSRKMKRCEIKIQSEDDDDISDTDMETYRRNSKVQYTKQEGKKILSEILEDFEELIKIQIAETKKYKKMGLLTDDTIEEIVDYHNELRERADDQMVHTIQHLVRGENLPDNFTMRINDKFQKIRQQLEVVIT